MSSRTSIAGFFTAVVAVLAMLPATAPAASPKPAWSVQSLAAPTHFAPGESGAAQYQVFITNNGGKVTDESEITITDTLPAGLQVKKIELFPSRGGAHSIGAAPACETAVVVGVSTVTCKVTNALRPEVEPAKLYPGNQLMLQIEVAVPPSAEGTLVNQVEVEGGGAVPTSGQSQNQASEEDAPAGFEEFAAELSGADGLPATGADSHPYQYTTSFGVNVVRSSPVFVAAEGDLKEIDVALPPGLVANPTAVERCSAQAFNTNRSVPLPEGGDVRPNECRPGSAVGLALLEQLNGLGGIRKVPVYNLIPPKGMPAQLGFQVVGAPVYINTRIRSNGDYGASAHVTNIPQAELVTASRILIWGTPWDESHDRLRGECGLTNSVCPAPGPPRPFLRLPSSCANPLTTTMSFETWAQPTTGASADSTEPPPTACSLPDFSPSITAKPTTNVADSPSGLHFDLHLPQKENEDPEGLAEADLKDATVTLPPGLVVNPSSANGLAGCSLTEIGYHGIEAGRHSFSDAPAQCPDAAKIGTVQVDTPLLDHPLPGSVYLASQNENPFHSLLAIYITVNDPITGVVVKLAGMVSADPLTGRLTTTVSESPQLPFEDFHLDFFEGARAPLRTPQTCGESPTVPQFTTRTSLTPWSAPESGPPAVPSDSFAMVKAPGGGSCATTSAALPNAPSFEAGTQDPLAGAYSPFLLRLKREDGSQEIKGLNVALPAGLTARLAGTAECPQAAVAQAQSRSKPGDGALEHASPSCPASSQLGTVTVAAGAGPTPFFAQGKAYLAGPYQGAPLSMVIVTPAVAGPFDLGAVTVRAALQVDPESTQVTVKSDPIPTILQGIPLDVRSIAVRIDRPAFTLNPTSCEVKALTAEALSVSGQTANLWNRFQVGGCSNLAFKPKLALKLKGGTNRSDYQALTATLTYPSKGAYANIAKALVALPHSEFLAQEHIRTICTRVQFAAVQCPPGSIYGYAKAITPLLDQPLQGPVYLRSSSNPLPDLVADLNGQIHVALVGRVDSIHGGIRNSFIAVPDAPVSRFTLSLRGGKKALLVNRHVHRAKWTGAAASAPAPGQVPWQGQKEAQGPNVPPLVALGGGQRQGRGAGRPTRFGLRLCLPAALFALAWIGSVPAASASGPPQIPASWSTDVTATSARLHAEISPAGSTTTYHFDYLTAAAYQDNLDAGKDGFAGAAKAPGGADPSLGSGSVTLAPSQPLSGLQPQTVYRYRVAAFNPAGPALGSAQTFVTPALSGSLTLLDNRGWEMVSPVDKNGGEVQGLGATGNLLQAGAGGGAIGFASSSSFGSGAQGAPALDQYLSRRNDGGWATQNVTVPQLSGGYGEDPAANPYRLFSMDLSLALLSNGQRCRGTAGECPVANPPLEGSGAPVGYRNYYLRDNVAGGYRALLTGADVAALTLTSKQFELTFAGAASDLVHVVLSTCAALTADATEVPSPEGCEPTATNLYEWSPAGGLSMLNLLPGAGTGTTGAILATSAGAVSANGSRVYWTQGGDLYLREGGQSVRVDEAVGGGGRFETATADGSLAFFSKAGHLYRYDAVSHTSTDLTPSGGVQGVLGTAADGSYLYYLTSTGLFLRRGAATLEVAAAADPANYPPGTGAARVSIDGSRLAFLSEASLTGYDNRDQATGEPVSEVFLYTAATGPGPGELVCASCNPTRGRPLGPSTLPGAIVGGEGADALPAYKPRALSADGRRLFFDSADSLVPRDTDNRPDVYEWEAEGSGSCQSPGGCLNLISSGHGSRGASFADASADGADAFFLSDDSLIASDPGGVDLYDARVNGGFPTPPTAIPCDGDACQPLPSPPEDPTPGTLVAGSPNPALSFPKSSDKKTKGQKHHRKHKHSRRAGKSHRKGARR
jgi:hypothetical protein